MKKVISSALVGMVVVATLTACAAPRKAEATRVKCPSCGYEFDAPAQD
jgi:hypothetical protein